MGYIKAALLSKFQLKIHNPYCHSSVELTKFLKKKTNKILRKINFVYAKYATATATLRLYE